MRQGIWDSILLGLQTGYDSEGASMDQHLGSLCMHEDALSALLTDP
jgi:hypothetical protein